MWAKFCGWILGRVLGWKAIGGPVKENKAIILGVPHTSAWDFVVSYLFYASFDAGPANIMIKKEFFVWPVGVILRKLGAIPVDRTNASTLVKSLITEMGKKDRFVLAIAPEGSRKAVKKWKTGYHLIAREVGCPVYMGYFDWGTRTISCGEKVELTDNARADTDRIQAIYGTMGLVGRHPDGYITH